MLFGSLLENLVNLSEPVWVRHVKSEVLRLYANSNDHVAINRLLYTGLRSGSNISPSGEWCNVNAPSVAEIAGRYNRDQVRGASGSGDKTRNAAVERWNRSAVSHHLPGWLAKWRDRSVALALAVADVAVSVAVNASVWIVEMQIKTARQPPPARPPKGRHRILFLHAEHYRDFNVRFDRFCVKQLQLAISLWKKSPSVRSQERNLTDLAHLLLNLLGQLGPVFIIQTRSQDDIDVESEESCAGQHSKVETVDTTLSPNSNPNSFPKAGLVVLKDTLEFSCQRREFKLTYKRCKLPKHFIVKTSSRHVIGNRRSGRLAVQVVSCSCRTGLSVTEQLVFCESRAKFSDTIGFHEPTSSSSARSDLVGGAVSRRCGVYKQATSQQLLQGHLLCKQAMCYISYCNYCSVCVAATYVQMKAQFSIPLSHHLTVTAHGVVEKVEESS
ncbi:hypothetical protein J6590_046081 [Homalodisca vitripennis]|nr:hypothetical protein J6590_046081 [Homalodisca vitripennis]